MDEPIEPVLPDDEGVTPPPLDESVIPSLGISGDQEAIAREGRREWDTQNLAKLKELTT